MRAFTALALACLGLALQACAERVSAPGLPSVAVYELEAQVEVSTVTAPSVAPAAKAGAK
jgi:hypothetical protein